MNKFNIYRTDTPNLGDLFSSPSLYFDYLKNDAIRLDIKSVMAGGVSESNSNSFDFGAGTLIVGGGGLLSNNYFTKEIDFLANYSAANLKVIWGAGQNAYEVNEFKDIYKSEFQDLSGFDLVGLRDYPTKYPWVPCASCLHPIFKEHDISPLHDVVSYLHHDTLKYVDLVNDLPNVMFNDNSDFRAVINHIKSGATLLTNSYHGAYWAQLLGRKVIAFPTSSKMYHFRFPLPMCSPLEWRRNLIFGYVADEALDSSIEANLNFSKKVFDRIGSSNNESKKLVKKIVTSAKVSNKPLYSKLKSIDENNVADVVQSKIISRLACPFTSGSVDIVPIEICGGSILNGLIISRQLNEVVGEIKNFQFDFVRYNKKFPLEKLFINNDFEPVIVDEVFEWVRFEYDHVSIKYFNISDEILDDSLVCLTGVGSTIEIKASGSIELLLSSHPWSGIVEILFGEEKLIVDLYAPHTTLPTPKIINLGPDVVNVTLKVLSERNDESSGHQCLFSGYKLLTKNKIPLRNQRIPKIRGAIFPERFWKFLDVVGQKGVLLDLGGGNRQILDQRYVNIDYASYAEPDIIGDAMALPFATGSIDAVYSSGVFEHIPNPISAGEEVARVLKFGGRALICWSFMQPLHSEGQHFFNATPDGVIKAFEKLKPVNIFYDNSLSFLFEWAISVSGLGGLVANDEIKNIYNVLSDLDKIIPEERKKYMANGVWIEFVKI